MTEGLNEILTLFDQAIKKKEKKSLGKSDIEKIHQSTVPFFQRHEHIPDDELIKLRDKWVELAGEKIDKGRAMKKLQGTSRAEAIHSVLISIL